MTEAICDGPLSFDSELYRRLCEEVANGATWLSVTEDEARQIRAYGYPVTYWNCRPRMEGVTFQGVPVFVKTYKQLMRWVP